MISQGLLQAHYQILSNNLSDRVHKVKYKYKHKDKKCGTCRIKYKHCHCFLEYKNFKEDLIEYICLLSNNNSQRKFDEKLKDRFINTYKFSNHDNNKFTLLLRKGVYPY